jgi:hypothetical protein
MQRPKKPRPLELLKTFEMNVGDGIVFLYFQLKVRLSSFLFGIIAGGGAMASGSTIVDSRIQFLLPLISLR